MGTVTISTRMLEKEFDYEGKVRRIELTFEDGLDERLAQKAIEWAAEIWDKLMSLGFISPGARSRRFYKITISIDSSFRVGGDYAANHINISPNDLIDGNDNGFRATLIHEFFHAVQHASSVSYLGKAITEGSATLAPYLVDDAINRNPLGCGDDYLNYPSETMWDRPSPGTETSSRCSSSLWWLYFTEQLCDPTDLSSRINVLKDFFDSVGQSPNWEFDFNTDEVVGIGNITNRRTDSLVLKNSRELGAVNLIPSDAGTVFKIPIGSRFGSGWKVRSGDQVVGLGDVTGNGRSELVLRSFGPDHIGIVGLDDNGNTATVAVVAEGQRFGSGWKLRDGDQVVGVGDITGNGRSEIVLRSFNPDHIGIVGLDDAGKTTTIAVVGIGQRFGSGWKVRDGDKVVGVGDITGNGRSEIVLRSFNPEHIGIVGLDDAGKTTTIAVVGEGQRFGSGWKVRDGDQVVGVADVTGNGRSELVLHSFSPDYIGVVGLDEDRNTITVAVVAEEQRFGTGWKVHKGNKVVGLGDFTGNGRNELVLRSFNPDCLGIVGLDDAGNTATMAVTSRTDGFSGFRVGSKAIGVGNFTRDAHSQILIRTENGQSSYMRVIEIDEQNQWKDRLTVMTGSKLGSLLTEFDHFIQSRTGRERTFETMWRDFSVTNLIKNLSGSGSKHTYLQSTTVTRSVAISETLAIGNSLENRNIDRWASDYIRIRPSSQGLKLKLRGGQAENSQPIYWTVIISASNVLKQNMNYKSIGIDEEIQLNPNDEVTVVVTTLYKNVKYSISSEMV